MRDQITPRCAAWAFVATVMVVTVGGLGCNGDRRSVEQPQHMTHKTIQQVQEEHTGEWMALPGVVGTAIGQRDGQPCILILTASNTEQIRQKIPATVEGYAVVVQYVGEIRARPISRR